jgi:quercetin dioxygenase-like cupin family protein
MTEPRWLFGSSCLTILADHTTTGGQYDLVETYFLPKKQTPLHRHTRYSEYLYVLEGEFTVWAGDNKIVLDAGDRFLIPVGIPHTVGVLNDRPGHGLVITAPSGFARLISAAGTLSKTEPMDMKLFLQICTEIGDEILAPPGTLPSA